MPTFEIVERRIISADNEYVTADMVRLCVESEIAGLAVGEVFTTTLKMQDGEGKTKSTEIRCRVVKANEVAVRKLTS